MTGTQKSFCDYTITYYKNGFTVNDLPIRSYFSKTNTDFLRKIASNAVPEELNLGGECKIAVIEKKNQILRQITPNFRIKKGALLHHGTFFYVIPTQESVEVCLFPTHIICYKRKSSYLEIELYQLHTEYQKSGSDHLILLICDKTVVEKFTAATQKDAETWVQEINNSIEH